MGAIATAGAVATSYLANAHCPSLNSSATTLIDPIATGPLDIEGSLAMNLTVDKTITVETTAPDLKIKILLKMNEKFLDILTSMPDTAETTCKVGIGIIGSLLTIETMLAVVAIGFVGKKVYDYASQPVVTNHLSDIEADYNAPLAHFTPGF